MKHVLPTLLVILFTCTFAHAVPASPDPIDVRQPDGSVIKARIQGDELQGWTESYDTGHTIIRNPASGYWVYAEPGKDGALRPGELRVLPKGQNAPSGIQKGLRPPRNKDAERYMQYMLRDSARIASEGDDFISPSATASAEASAAAVWNPTPVSGTRKLLVVMVSFADRTIQTTPSGWYRKIFDEADMSVARYYKDNSFSNMSIAPVSHAQVGNPAGIVSVTLSANHPNTGSSYTFASDQAWGNSALQLASSYVDFNGLDINGNGRLDTSEVVIYFIVAGYEASGSSKKPSVWAHAWSTTGTGLTVNSKNIQRWALNGELNDSSVQHPMGVIAHELGHQMCGLPDLYDVSQFNAGLGNFSIMASGSWGRDIGEVSGSTPISLDAWSREYLGWSSPLVPDASNPLSPLGFGYQLSSATTPYKLVLPSTSASEYFLLENRWPIGWDLGLRGMSYFGSGWQGGLLVLHIDNNAGTKINDYTNNAGNRQGVIPVQASTATCNMLVSGSVSSCRGNPRTLFYSGNNVNWTPSSTPNSNYYSGSLTNFYLTAISAPGSTMTAEFSLGPPAAPGAPNMELATRGDRQASVAFSAPASDGGSAITGYTATSWPGGKTASGTSSPIVVPALTNGTAYTFTVTAVNGVGTSLPSTPSTSVTPATVPGAPSVGVVTVGSGQATVSFSAPATDGGSVVTGYTVTSNAGQTASAAMSPVTVTGLTNGTAYTFRVSATNSVGAGSFSTSSASTKTGPVRNSGFSTVGYLTLQSAYAADTHTPEIQIAAESAVGPLVKDESDAVTIRGGYDAAFTDSSGLPAVLGPVVLRKGKTRMQSVVIRP